MNNGVNNTNNNQYIKNNQQNSNINNITSSSTSFNVPQGNKNVQEAKIIKQKSKIAPFLFFVIIILGFYIGYSYLKNKNTIQSLTYNCTPISSAKEEKKLDLDSTIVRDLYDKVYTNIREDIAQPEWNNQMKLYLAYRQIPTNKKYESNCNLFNQSAMDPYTCSDDFNPLAFKEEDLELQWKKLFGEKTTFTNGNIKLQYDCIGGYQYIADRKEYVQGYCQIEKSPSLRATKKLIEATSTGNTITLKEEVNYSGGEGINVPEYLKNGYYFYNFRLDMNYNYVFVNRIYQSKY